jgi:hypothetical protein
MADDIDKALGDFVTKGMAAEQAAGQAIGDALHQSVDRLAMRAREGDPEAAAEIARVFLGRDQAGYIQMLIETSGMRFPSLGNLLSRAVVSRSFDAFNHAAGAIVQWAEALVVYGRCMEPPRTDLYSHDVLLWSDHIGRRPEESFVLPKVPERLRGQQHTMKWLTWLGFTVRASKHPHPGVTAETLYIVVEPEQLAQEAKRLQRALCARGVRGVQVEAEYKPHLGFADDCSIRVMVHDEHFRPSEVADAG